MLFVSYGDGFVPSDGDIRSIRRACEAGCFVVLVHAAMDRANEFLGHVGLPPHFNIEGDGGEQKLVEILAVYKQPRDDGGTDIFTWVTPEYTAPVKSESPSDDDPAKEPLCRMTISTSRSSTRRGAGTSSSTSRTKRNASRRSRVAESPRGPPWPRPPTTSPGSPRRRS